MSTLAFPSGVPSPQAARRSPGRAACVGVVTVVFLVFPLLITAIIVPKFEQIFKDFGVALSPLARGFIELSHALGSPLGLAVATVWVAGAITLVVLVSLRWRVAALLLLVLGVVFSGLYLVALVVAMYLPLVAMIESLQQGGAV